MAKLLPILTFPHPFLKTKAKTVTVFDENLEKLAQDMLETMYQSQGIGLAAVQVGKDRRLIVVDVTPSENESLEKNPMIFVNPVIIQKGVEKQSIEEGCLSVPEFRAKVERAKEITLQYETVKGETKKLEMEGLLSICVQHEIDHLNGILFIDYLPPLKKSMVQKKLKKLARIQK